MNKLILNNIEEVKSHVGGLSNINFEYLKPDLTRSVKFITDFVGEAVYTKLQEYYEGEYDANGDAGLDKLVWQAQDILVFKAMHAYAPEGNVVFDGEGIHIQKANDKQATAFEWQIDKLLDKYLVLAYNGIDVLIDLLNKYRDEDTGWKDSDYETKAKALFIRSATEFQSSLYIDRSQRLYLSLLPFMRRIQDREIKNTVGDRYTRLLNETGLSEVEKEMRLLCCDAQAHLAMAKAVVQFPLEIMPNSVVERFKSFFTTLNASKEARKPIIDAARSFYQNEGQSILSELAKLIYNTDKTDDEPTYKPRRSFSRNAMGF